VDDLIERLRSVQWEEADDCGRMPDDPTHKCVFVDMRPDDFRALLREAADALEAAREDGWQPIETAPKPNVGADGFGVRLLLAVDCGDGTIPSVRRGYWEGTDWYLDCCIDRATACGYRVTHWRPLPAPPPPSTRSGRSVTHWRMEVKNDCLSGHNQRHRDP